MAIGEYVDMDLYGRGFDGIYGKGAEEANKRQALMKFKAIWDFKKNVRPGEYIDLDLYGRGDPRVFGPNAHIQTLKEAAQRLEEAQKRKRERKVHLRALVFPSGLKAIVAKSKTLAGRMSSSNGEPKDDVKQPDDEKRDDLVGNTSRTVDEATFGEDTSDVFEVIDNTPRRVKSKLPSEEARPLVEPGHVARVLKSLKSLTSFDSGETRSEVTSKAEPAFEPALPAEYSSFPLHGTSSPEPSASSSENSNATQESQDSSEEENSVQERGVPESVSTVNAGAMFVASDEEFPLSFSSPQDNVGGGDSTGEEEDLVERSVLQSVAVDEYGRGEKIAGLFRSGDTASGSASGSTGTSEKSDKNRDQIDSLPNLNSGSDDFSSGNDFVDNAGVEDRGTSTVATEHVELEDSIDDVENAGAEDLGTSTFATDHAEPEITDNVENARVTDREAAALATEPTEPAKSKESTAELAVNYEDVTVMEDVNVDNTFSSSGTDSSAAVTYDEGASDVIVDSDEIVESGDSVMDSDRSEEAKSSSVVVTTSTEDEILDSDEVVIEGMVEDGEVESIEDMEKSSDEVAEESSEEVVEQSSEEIEEEDSDVHIVDSSDGVITFDNADNADGSHNDDGDNSGQRENVEDDGGGRENRTFWQRLSLFGAILWH